MKKLVLALLLFVFALPIWAADKEGGIVGTGIVGQVTGLSEFEVGGMQFETDAGIELIGLNSFADLKMGMTLAVRAERRGNEWQATQIRRILLLAGPVTGPSEVMGIPIVGDVPSSGRVAIDGFWSQAGIVATRIEQTTAEADEITGPADQIKRVGQLFSPDGSALELAGVDVVTLKGRYSDRRFSVQEQVTGLFAGIPPNLLMAQGFLSPSDSNDEYELLGTGSRSADPSLDRSDPQKKSTYCSFNGRLDFVLEDVAPHERETVISLCANIPG